MDYYNSMLPQNQPPMMQSAAAMHYSQMAQPEIGQDLWDHEKHVSLPSVVSQVPTNKRIKPNYFLSLLPQNQGWSKWTN